VRFPSHCSSLLPSGPLEAGEVLSATAQHHCCFQSNERKKEGKKEIERKNERMNKRKKERSEI
jgi:hypothetical protein